MPLETIELREWNGAIPSETQTSAIEALESGKVLYMPRLGFRLHEEEQAFLSPQVAKAERKNITLDPRTGECHGCTLEGEDKRRMELFIGRFAETATDFLHRLIPAYAPYLERARTTFRPVEITGRNYSQRKDDKRLHVDAFPASPTGGRRILRFFANIHPQRGERIWRIGDQNFENFAKGFLPRLRPSSGMAARLLHALHITKKQRSAYDELMLQLHDRCKLDEAYQRDAPRQTMAFPAMSTWMCFTDQVLHAAMSGQFALEQTFYLDVAHMRDPARAPIKVLERLTGKALEGARPVPLWGKLPEELRNVPC